jgi:putative heme-binding domain-containing protein
MFVKNCAICHQLRGEGKVFGPQLDGVHTRGAERLIEDILAPNRHVDPNFRTNLVTLKDGRLIPGVPRGETATTLSLIDQAGLITTIDKADIQKRQETPLSLMPTHFGETLSSDDLNALVGFLLRGELEP